MRFVAMPGGNLKSLFRKLLPTATGSVTVLSVVKIQNLRVKRRRTRGLQGVPWPNPAEQSPCFLTSGLAGVPVQLDKPTEPRPSAVRLVMHYDSVWLGLSLTLILASGSRLLSRQVGSLIHGASRGRHVRKSLEITRRQPLALSRKKAAKRGHFVFLATRTQKD